MAIEILSLLVYTHFKNSMLDTKYFVLFYLKVDVKKSG